MTQEELSKLRKELLDKYDSVFDAKLEEESILRENKEKESEELFNRD